MPFCQTSQEFWPKYSVGFFAPKHVDSVFCGQRKKRKILRKEKKNWGKFCTKMPLVLIGIEFRPECNVAIFARKILDSIFRGLESKCIAILKNK